MNYNSLAKSVDTQPGVFICTWDLGRRCNFDCTYCGDDSHDNFSPHSQLSSLKDSVDFIYSYFSLILKNRINQEFSINLTGGEPTANPNFLDLSHYLKNRKGNSQLEGADISNTVTSNGSFSKAIRQAILKCFDGATISYHCDSPSGMREKVIENIEWLHQNRFKLKTNIMFHNKADLFQECVDLEKYLRDRGIRSVPRIINGFTYTEEQASWFQQYWNEPSLKIETKKNLSENEKVSSKPKAGKFISGRHCCMKIPLSLTPLQGSASKDTNYCGDTNFKGWNCGVNWKFLHVDQQRDEILHHQTCQANWGKTRGPIGQVSNWQKVIADLKQRLSRDRMEALECTLEKCFCGVCAPKSYDIDRFNLIMSRHVKGLRFEPT